MTMASLGLVTARPTDWSSRLLPAVLAQRLSLRPSRKRGGYEQTHTSIKIRFLLT